MGEHSNNAPDASPGSRDETPRPVQGKGPLDKGGAPGLVGDPATPASNNGAPGDGTPRDVAIDSDWPAAGRDHTQDQPADEQQALAQAGREALAEHAQAQEHEHSRGPDEASSAGPRPANAARGDASGR